MFENLRKTMAEAKRIVQENADTVAPELKGKKGFAKMRAIGKEAAKLTKQETERMVAEEKKEQEEQTAKEAKKEYNWGEMFSSSVHTYTLALLTYTIANAGFRLYVYWAYDLFAQLWVYVTFYAIAVCTVVCWAICWWAQIAPRLITAKNPWKNNKVMFIIVMFSLPFYFLMIPNDALTDIDGRGSITCILIIFGGQVALRFLLLWLQFRSDPQYKRISFIDYCNLPIAEK